jgi:chemotaxis protein histidine kinase CheA
MKLQLDKISTDGGTQSRAALNEDVVAEYAEVISAGADMPPVTVFQDGKKYWLADGFHRYFAHQKALAVEIAADVQRGTKRDAILHSLGANAYHGLRRTNEDKRAAVLRMLDDKEWKAWSDREIAKTCGVTHPFVASIRNPKPSAPAKVVTVTTQAPQTAPLSHSASFRIDAPNTAASLAEQRPPAAEKPHSSADCEPRDLAETARRAAPSTNTDATPLIDLDRSLLEQIVELREQLVESQQNAAELADLLDGYSKAEQGEKVTAKEIAKLNGQLRVVASQRDQYMTTCNELKRTVKGLQRENEGLKKKVGAAK